MALGNNSGGRKTFLNIKEGKIALRDRDGNVQTFTELSGVLTSITFKDGKFDKELHLTITDRGEDYLLQMKADGGYARTFMMAIKNADLKVPMVLVPKFEIVNDRKKSTLFINQHGKGLKWFWTRDNPGELPQPTFREWKGKIEWDYTVQQAYLENMLLTEIVPQLVHPAVAASTDPGKEYQQAEAAHHGEPEDDDLPF